MLNTAASRFPQESGYRIRCLNFVDAALGEVRLALVMKPLNFRIVPLPSEVAEAARRMAATGAPDHVFVTADSPLAFPCRRDRGGFRSRLSVSTLPALGGTR